jgi:hypothetical protein
VDFKTEEVTLLLLNSLGYQGGTIHQASQETGLSVSEILKLSTNEHQIGLTSDQSKGFSSVLTNSLEFNRNNLFPKFKGNINYWFGACRAQKYLNTKGG